MCTCMYVSMYVCTCMCTYMALSKKWHESERGGSALSFLEGQIESERYANTWPCVGKGRLL